ncbi:MAG TPA: DMT family transporter [Gaiellaceae bacterium]|jgi:drug/metabolite transporter (DMT)-like permease|nr:DMT family transporter [Gaiellaceae bacterium]
MLLGAVLLWALNVTVSKYLLEHGWRPLAYGTIRYFAAISLFWLYTYHRERSFRIERRHLRLVGAAALALFVNQLFFVYSLKVGQASTLVLVFGSTPVFAGLLTLALRIERLQRSFWAGAGLTFAGVVLVGVGAGASTGPEGIFLGLGTAFTWAVYTIAIAPLMRTYSPYRVSAVVLAIGWIPLALVSISQVTAQHFSFGWKVWLGFGYAVVGPLFLTNILWFTAVAIVGSSRATLFNNLQPFFGVLFAVLILSESLHAAEIVGGLFIFAGIVLERVRRRPSADAVPGRGDAAETDVRELVGPE